MPSNFEQMKARGEAITRAIRDAQGERDEKRIDELLEEKDKLLRQMRKTLEVNAPEAA